MGKRIHALNEAFYETSNAHALNDLQCLGPLILSRFLAYLYDIQSEFLGVRL